MVSGSMRFADHWGTNLSGDADNQNPVLPLPPIR